MEEGGLKVNQSDDRQTDRLPIALDGVLCRLAEGVTGCLSNGQKLLPPCFSFKWNHLCVWQNTQFFPFVFRHTNIFTGRCCVSFGTRAKKNLPLSTIAHASQQSHCCTLQLFGCCQGKGAMNGEISKFVMRNKHPSQGEKKMLHF